MCTEFHRGALNRTKVVVGNRTVIENWTFPDYIREGCHTWQLSWGLQGEDLGLEGCVVTRKVVSVGIEEFSLNTCSFHWNL